MLNDRKIRMGEDPKKRLMTTSAITLKSIDAARTAVENLKRQEGDAWQSSGLKARSQMVSNQPTNLQQLLSQLQKPLSHHIHQIN
jgi:flagellar biosynthesis chaperone FliJ